MIPPTFPFALAAWTWASILSPISNSNQKPFGVNKKPSHLQETQETTSARLYDEGNGVGG